MSEYFYRGQFDKYEVTSQLSNSLRRLDESAENLIYFSDTDGFSKEKVKIFLSHKHDDLDFPEVQHIIKFFESSFNVKVYIDSKDANMPAVTNSKTAERIKNKIIMADKFIFLATNNSIQSMWCNWEVGFGDFAKFDSNNIAIFPMLDKKNVTSDYKGNEYLRIYPSIVYQDGTQKYDNGRIITKGYYYKKLNGNTYYLTKLEDWLNED